jgi:hypothetical protein
MRCRSGGGAGFSGGSGILRESGSSAHEGVDSLIRFISEFDCEPPGFTMLADDFVCQLCARPLAPGAPFQSIPGRCERTRLGPHRGT